MTCKEGIYKNVNLPTEDVLRLLKVIRGGSRRAGGDLVETGGQVGGGVGCLSANGVEVGNGGVLALRKGDELVAGALEDCKRDQVRRHFSKQVLADLAYLGCDASPGLVWTCQEGTY